MTKEDAHLYLPLVQALAAGKTVQVMTCGKFIDLLGDIIWGSDPENYRVKPEPVMVPLGPDDVPPGSVFRHQVASRVLWVAPTVVDGDSVLLSAARYTWGDLKNDFLIKRPGEDWQPCFKEVAP